MKLSLKKYKTNASLNKNMKELTGETVLIPKKFCPYFPAQKVQKWVDITTDGRQIALFDLDYTSSKNSRSATDNKVSIYLKLILGKTTT
jgi:hypothetical protein